MSLHLALALGLLWIVVALMVGITLGRAADLGDTHPPAERDARCACSREVVVWCLCGRALCARCATRHVPSCPRHREVARHLGAER